ncbi:LacI family DNA-binding transcriptional regulator [Marinitenerispora sediminis]|uniref:LacI family transcriptional regulator n=1 Tax=Marinitenerispora sediminis TaxID=1931232 RepID=A0A368T1U4_9ACTN|nr:LacI family DNA-binding transcriptional regulator [Marinitenerispora sediminis]RCV48696.1 LacI family transcriptional regulator [Marinitenerispora sediminis]RCV49139.1 LacI family transcriptional regulator [Marinitenerispora sediminis]RCV50815.1 LacI family transcriptional regulator [Marinitenerispora sediminis]
MGSGYVTLEQVARHAGVSLATASRVLNGSTRQVGEELRRRVTASAHELGYLANASAQTLARNTSTLVGLVVHDIADPYFSSIASGVTRSAEEQGLIVVLGTTGRAPRRETQLLATLRSHRARAVVLAGSRTVDDETGGGLAEEITMFTRQGGRVACVSQEGLPADTVVPDNRNGAAALARHLVDLGHRRFAILAGPTDLRTARDRLDGFHSALSAGGIALDPHNVVHGAFTRDGGYESTRRLLATGTDATCLFAVNDVMATGAMAALRDAGLRVPHDLSVAGFDDIPTLRDLTPGLTTVRLPLEWMGEKAARLALEEDPPAEARTVSVAGEVVVRDSTAPPAGA